jgi:hypothetical protein
MSCSTCAAKYLGREGEKNVQEGEKRMWEEGEKKNVTRRGREECGRRGRCTVDSRCLELG